MKVKVLGYSTPYDFEDVDEVRWSLSSPSLPYMDPSAEPGKRVLYLEPGTEFLIDNRGEADATAP